MDAWWHAENGEVVGPINLDALVQKLSSGQLMKDTLVWKAGMATWLPFSAVDELWGRFAPPPLPDTVVRVTEASPTPPPLTARPAIRTADTRLAGAWRRYWARCFDLLLANLLLGILVFASSYTIGLIVGGREAQIYAASIAQHPGFFFLFCVVAVPLALLVDGFIYGVFGATPGKAMLGLSVVDSSGKPLSFEGYTRRNMRLWLRGLALGIPLANLVTVAIEGLRVGGRRPASYDEQTGQKVLVRPAGWASVTGFVFSAMALYVVFAILLSAAFSMARPIREAAGAGAPATAAAAAQEAVHGIDGLSWTNPLTRVTVVVTKNWKASVLAQPNNNYVTIFRDDFNRGSVHVFPTDPALQDLQAQATAYRKLYAKDYHFADNGYRLYDQPNKPSWVMFGELKQDPSVEVRVEVLSRRNAVWFLVSFRSKSDTAILDSLQVLRGAIKDSIDEV